MNAQTIRMHGAIKGMVRAKSVFLASTARMAGDVEHESLAIEPGAYMEGHCKRITDSGSNTPMLEVRRPDSTTRLANGVQPKTALAALQVLEADERIVLLHEPDGLDEALKKLAAPCATTPNLWTDAYHAAFAVVAGLQVVSFDRGFSKFRGLAFLLLESGTAV